MLNSRNTKSAPGRGWFIAIVTLLLAMATLSGCSVINVYDEGALVQKYYGLPIYTIDSTQAQKLFSWKAAVSELLVARPGYLSATTERPS